MKLKDIVLVLVNSFQEFTALFNARENLEGKSFGCMTSILHSIDLIVRSFVYGIDKKLECTSSQGGANVAVWDVSVSSAFLKKLFPLFPLHPDRLPQKVDLHLFLLSFRVISKENNNCKIWSLKRNQSYFDANLESFYQI
jgi:pre-rRNA-processing protein IPI1